MKTINLIPKPTLKMRINLHNDLSLVKMKTLESIPKSADNLGFNSYKYTRLVKNVCKINKLTQEEREDILNRACKELPAKIDDLVEKLQIDLAYEKAAYKFAEIPYWKGPPKDKKIFISTIADYLLKNKEIIQHFY